MTPRPGVPDNIDRDLESKLSCILLGTPWFHKALTAVKNLGIESARIGAGAIRNAVWDSLHGYSSPSLLADIDVVYFDDGSEPTTNDRLIEAHLCRANPDLPWEVTNQATVHRWFESYFGYQVLPLRSVEDAVRTWPETATCVAVKLGHNDTIEIVAPFGLRDLFAMKIRWNPTRITREGFLERVRQKNYLQRWPRVEIILPDEKRSFQRSDYSIDFADGSKSISEQ